MALKNIDTAVILAGGMGTRLSEQTKTIPKPLVRIGELPIMIHIMRRLQKSGVKEFFILGGYLNEEIWSYLLRNIKTGTFPSKFDKNNLSLELEDSILPDSKVHLVYTGVEAGTAERIKAIKDLIGNKNFIMTYGDSYSDVDVSEVEEKLTEGKVVSLCAIPYSERFGIVEVEGTEVKSFKEKSSSHTEYINGGFICLTPEIFDYISDSAFDFSSDVLQLDELKGKISAHPHFGYWKAVDTQRDFETINKDYIEHKEYFN